MSTNQQTEQKWQMLRRLEQNIKDSSYIITYCVYGMHRIILCKPYGSEGSVSYLQGVIIASNIVCVIPAIYWVGMRRYKVNHRAGSPKHLRRRKPGLNRRDTLPVHTSHIDVHEQQRNTLCAI